MSPLTAETLSGRKSRIQNSDFRIQNWNPSCLRITPLRPAPPPENWWRGGGGKLRRGKLVAIDYGHTAEETFSPARHRGTLRAYFQHRVSDDLLANVGKQDLTAHVNFSAIQSVGNPPD